MDPTVVRFNTLTFVIIALLLASLSECSNLTNKHEEDDDCYPNDSAYYLVHGRAMSSISFIPESEDIPIPAWANLTLVHIGQRFAVKNAGYVSLSHLLGLIYTCLLPEIKDILLASGGTSLTQDAVPRYAQTATTILSWYNNSVEIPDQRRNLLQSLAKVRQVHSNAAFKIQQKLKDAKYLEKARQEIFSHMSSKQRSLFNDKRFWTAIHADLNKESQRRVGQQQRCQFHWKYNGIPITQFGQALTQFSFVGLTVLFHRQLGISEVTEEELRGFIHLWALFGHALGIQEKYNICIERDLEKNRKLFREIFDTYYAPALFQMDPTSHIELSALLEGVPIIVPTITAKQTMFRFLRDFAQIKPTHLYRHMSILDRLGVASIDAIMENNASVNRWISKLAGRIDHQRIQQLLKLRFG